MSSGGNGGGESTTVASGGSGGMFASGCDGAQPGDRFCDVDSVFACTGDLSVADLVYACGDGTCAADGSASCDCNDPDAADTGSGCATVDDCAAVASPCNDHGVCADGVASYTCACEPLFVGDICDAQLPLHDMRGITIDDANNRALVLDAALLAIVAVDLSDGARTVISDDEDTVTGGGAVGTGPAFSAPQAISMDAAGGRLFVVDDGLDAVLAVDLTSGDRTIVSDADHQGTPVGTGIAFARPVAVAHDAANTRLLVSDTIQDVIIAVDLTNGNRTSFSDDSDAGQPLSNAVGIALDAANGRLLAVDRTYDAVLAISLTNGDRSVLSDQNDDQNGNVMVGSGPALQRPVSIGVDVAGGRAIVGDEDVAGIFSVDLASGNRTLLSDAFDEGSSAEVGSGTYLLRTDDLAVAGSGLFVADAERNDVLRVDLTNGDRSILSSARRGDGVKLEAPRALVANDAGDAVFVGLVSFPASRIVSVDVDTGDRTLVSHELLRGDGPTILEPISIAYRATPETVYVVDVFRNGILSVDTTTGDRVLLSDDNDEVDGLGMVGTGVGLGGPRGIATDVANGRLLVVDESLRALVSVGLATGNRTVISDDADSANGGAQVGTGPGFVGPAWIARDGSRAIVCDTTLAALFSVDLATGNRTVISDDDDTTNGNAMVGTGPSLSFAKGLTIDTSAGTAYVTITALGAEAIIAVDLTNGNRSYLSSYADGVGNGIELMESYRAAFAADAVWVAQGRRSVVRIPTTGPTAGDRIIWSAGATAPFIVD